MTEERSAEIPRARTVGRMLRLLLGALLTWMTYDVMRAEDMTFNFKVAAVFIVMTVFYSSMHWVITRYVRGLNPWLGAALAVVPAVLVYGLGGPVGRVASVAYIGVSLVLQAVRGDGGCEVMSIPGVIFQRRTHLVCLAFSPIDWLENRMAQRRAA